MYELRSCAYFSLNFEVSSPDSTSESIRKIGFYCTHLDVHYEEVRLAQLSKLLVQILIQIIMTNQQDECVDNSEPHLILGDFSILSHFITS